MAITPKPSKITVTLNDLFDGKKVLGHSSGEQRKVSIVKMTPVPSSKQLVINAIAMGSKPYTLTMSFFDVKYSKQQSREFPLTVSLGDGEYLYAEQIDFKTARAQIRCSCTDFYFTWSHYDKENKALSGPAMKPYVRKTTTRPERNAAHAPGMCKHLMTLTQRLIDQKIIKR